eukprot:6206957-Pleurochrysis_carterae.AAC.2
MPQASSCTDVRTQADTAEERGRTHRATVSTQRGDRVSSMHRSAFCTPTQKRRCSNASRTAPPSKRKYVL